MSSKGASAYRWGNTVPTWFAQIIPMGSKSSTPRPLMLDSSGLNASPSFSQCLLGGVAPYSTLRTFLRLQGFRPEVTVPVISTVPSHFGESQPQEGDRTRQPCLRGWGGIQPLIPALIVGFCIIVT